jgi:iron complex transport system ATP-binding protein
VPRRDLNSGPDDGLVLRNITAGYGGRDVVRDVSLRAAAGQMTGLIGPNGSGKTTLVRVASRGLRPHAGTVRVAGRDPYAMPARRAARSVAVVPQEVAPAFAYTVLEIVLMGRTPYVSPWGGGKADDWAAVRLAMQATSIHHLADRPIEALSGGERQRVVLAQALAQDAPVLVLDEPTTHLDIRHVVEILGLVRSLARDEGRAVLSVFHDLNLASQYCDRIYALAGGRVEAEGSPGAVLTPVLIRRIFGIEADVSPSGGTGRPAVIPSPPVSAVQGGGGAGRAHVIGGAGGGASILRALAEAGFVVSTGVMHIGDTDQVVAERLNLLRVTVPPFSLIDPRSAADCREMIAGADVLVVCDAPFGPGNVGNLQLALQAARSGVRTYILDRVPINERDFTGGLAEDLWRAVGRLSVTCVSEQELIEGVTADSTAGLPSRPGPSEGR